VFNRHTEFIKYVSRTIALLKRLTRSHVSALIMCQVRCVKLVLHVLEGMRAMDHGDHAVVYMM
jgi:hypothetical protein